LGKIHLENIPWLEDGLTNEYGIEVEIINTLPLRARRHWRHVDFEKYEKMIAPETPEEEKEPETPQEPSDDNYLWQVEKNARTDVDVKELSEERKAKVKMIALAELEEQRKKDPVQSAVNEALERLKKEKEVKSWDV
jgi:hypothetical protein